MTQEQKDLLLKDLCARLPYGVKCEVQEDEFTYIGTLCKLEIDNANGNLLDFEESVSGLEWQVYLSEVKPYLFPLLSMTDEQCEELNNLIHEHFILDDGFNEGISFKTYGDILVWLDEKPINQCYFIFDYFNKNHLDYRELIPMSLALDATGINVY